MTALTADVQAWPRDGHWECCKVAAAAHAWNVSWKPAADVSPFFLLGKTEVAAYTGRWAPFSSGIACSLDPSARPPRCNLQQRPAMEAREITSSLNFTLKIPLAPFWNGNGLAFWKRADPWSERSRAGCTVSA